ncbi:MAG: DNA gyrase inhibitor YacG, partial [Gammaproteobacteria bacterium]|nr:DNA gyrase inhibitor YacG [Gammaproteobacteria bacterium]
FVHCPTCNKLIPWTEEYPDRPFCSERCKLIDLGEWASENYRIKENSPEKPFEQTQPIDKE